MNKTLGIDLGSNSLGWAILDDSTLDIVDKGVVVFPEGVDLEAGSSLDTRSAKRRSARMGRRMRFHRKLRKWHLLSILIDAKMCPLTHAELDAWRKHGIYPVGNADFIRWLRATDVANPYCDRNAAANGPVPPFTLGRALYHICQRRGFKSSRKEEAVELDSDSGETKKDIDKKQGEVKQGILALTQGIAESGAKTLGQYFFSILERDKDKPLRQRVRGLYTGRIEHYLHEFNVIMDAQKISGQLRKDLEDAIFRQRPLRSQKHLVGHCPLEPKSLRAQIGHPAFEEFRMLAFINNLSLEDEDHEWRDDDGNLKYPLNQTDRNSICAEVSKIKKPTFKTLYKMFKKDPRFAKQGLRFHYFDETDTIPSCPTRLKIAEAFGSVEYDEQLVFNALSFFDNPGMLEDWFRKHYPQLDEKAVKAAAAIYPPEGNANYSLKAINRILPFLRRGYELSHARFCAKLPDVVPNYAAREDEVLLHIEETYHKHRHERAERARLDPRARKNLPAMPTLHERYAEMLLKDFGVTSDMFQQLYLYDDAIYEKETCYYPHGEYSCGKRNIPVMLDRPRLPPVQLGMIRNPLVQRSMTTLRRLVNYLGEHGKLDTDDTIRIELARSVNDFATRRAWQLWQNERRKKRESAVSEISKYCKIVTEDAIDRYVLAEEQNWICLYTGKQINVTNLLSGKAFDIEHTVPRSLSGDDALVNKTICDQRYNRDVKQGRIPKDCPNWDRECDGFGPIEQRLRPWREHFEKLKKIYESHKRNARTSKDPKGKCEQRVKALVTKFELDYWHEKLQRFQISMDRILERQTKDSLGFKRRQLVDTGIMCSHAVDLLKCLYPKTFSVNGAATAFARKAWGLQGDEAKDRSEHTHHAKDAMVIAALTPARFTAICTALKDDGVWRGRECDACPPPCDGFADKVRVATGEILVKHVLRLMTMRQSYKRNVPGKTHPLHGIKGNRMVSKVLSTGDTVRGQLHEDTYYGKIIDPSTGKMLTVLREKIAGEKIEAIEKLCPNIVDVAIREIVRRQLSDLSERGLKNVPADGLLMPSGVPIRRVRVRITGARQSPSMIKRHAHQSKCEYKNYLYASSAKDSNFRTAIYSVNGKLAYKTENVLEWAQNHKKDTYVPPDAKEGFVGYIYPDCMALAVKPNEDVSKLTQKELSKRLYYVRTLPTDKESRAEIQYHATATKKKEITDRSSVIDPDHPHQLIRTADIIREMLFEGIHFRMMLDGTIKFL